MQVKEPMASLLWSILVLVYLVVAPVVVILHIMGRNNEAIAVFAIMYIGMLGIVISIIVVNVKRVRMKSSEVVTQAGTVRKRASKDDDSYLEPRTDHKDKPALPQKPAPVSKGHSSDRPSSADQHIYDDPYELAKEAKKSSKRHEGRDSGSSGSYGSSRYDKVHDYANTQGRPVPN